MPNYSAIQTVSSRTLLAFLLAVVAAPRGSAGELAAPLEPVLIDAYPDDRILDTFSDSENCDIIITSRQDYPRLMLNSGGPTATVRALAFSPDSSRFYAAGLDKTVHAWAVRAQTRGIRRSTPNQAIHVQSLRWEITRGLRGSIYTIAANPSSREIAIAGYSARDATGDIVIYDSAQQRVVRALQGHRQAVVTVAFSPDGKKLVSVTRDGEVRLWTEQNQWQSQILQEASGVSTQFQPAAFLDGDRLVYSTVAEADNWQLTQVTLSDANITKTRLAQTYAHRITSVAVSGSGAQWAAGDWAGNVYLHNDQGSTRLRKGSVALDMSFAPVGQLFIATARSPKQLEGGQRNVSTLECWDISQRTLLEHVVTSRNDHNFACEVSPDGSRVVTYSGDDNSLLVYLLKDRTGTAIASPLTKRPLRLGGSGRKKLNVAFEKGTYRIGVSSRPDRVLMTVFDLANPSVVAGNPAQLAWHQRGENAPGWQLRIVGNDRTKLQLYNGKTPAGTIDVDPQVFGNVRSYCWLANGQTPYGIALGTDVQNGVYVFRIVAQGPCPLLRYFRDHQDYVSALSPSTDGKYLASASADQTVKVWSLEGLTQENAFPKAEGWGASFQVDQGRVVVRDVLEAGTAARKGIRQGDVIVEAKFSPSVGEQLNLGAESIATDPETIFEGLKRAKLYENVLLTVQRLGKRLNQQILLVPAWEPVATLFLASNDEWAFWTPRGYYDASINGDELFGWIVNRGVALRPEFYRADQFRLELERPDVLENLLAQGNLQSSLRLSRKAIPRDVDRVVSESIREKPTVRIVSPYDGAEIAQSVVRIRAVVDYPSQDAADRIVSSAYVNGVPGKVVDSQFNGRQRTYEWNVPSRDRYNRLRVVAQDIAPDRMVNFSDVHFRLKDEQGETAPPRLHLVTLAASNYQFVDKLECSITDATAVTAALSDRSRELYQPGEIIHLHNEKATRENLLQTVENLKQRLSETRPDDLVVLFLAGHGIAWNGEYYFVPVDASAESIEAKGIAWKDIRTMSELPCRKLVLLDTCHSGSVLPLSELGAANWKAAIRPLKMDEFLVLSATDVGQEALEFGEHGIFTKCLLEAFAGQGTPGAETVFLNDVVQYVESEVPKRTAKLKLQTPKSSPAELFEIISVPLTTTMTN